MTPYHKIKTVWNRDPATKWKTLIEGSWAIPEFEILKGIQWDWYEKVDGTNIRVICDPFFSDTVIFKGRSDKAHIPPFLLDKLRELFPVDFFADAFDLKKSGQAPICLYGEGFGERIQKIGKEYGKPDFCLFDIRIGDMWLQQDFVSGIAGSYELWRAPLMGRGPLMEAIDWAQNTIESTWGGFDAEGLILRPPVDLFNSRGGRIIGKIKTKDFNSRMKNGE